MPTATGLAVRMETVLFQTDAPDLVVARDTFGQAAYLCSLIDIDLVGYHFVAVQISSDRLASLRTGAIDLRAALVEPEAKAFYHGHSLVGRGGTIHLEEVDALPEDWLPDPGFLLSNFHE